MLTQTRVLLLKTRDQKLYCFQSAWNSWTKANGYSYARTIMTLFTFVVYIKHIYKAHGMQVTEKN